MKSFAEYSKIYEMTVGLEVHVELKTKTKIFCSCAADFGGEPNTRCCPVCMGAPGVLPHLNAEAVRFAVKAGLVTSCEISELSRFDRKNYFYPDLPKAYQITQLDHPLCRNGHLDIATKNGAKRIRIERIHLEEDAGKLLHTKEHGSMIDHNRCGVPLIEIVSAPDISSGEEAREYLKALRLRMLYAGISDCKMNEGSLRCDVNISVKKRGEITLGERCEIKNLNSFAFVEKAIDYEFRRQCALIETGERITAETRRFDESSETTEAMRSKETSGDYRYFPEPDLPWVRVSSADLELLRSKLPQMPESRAENYKNNFSLETSACEILTSSPALSDYFERAAGSTYHPKALANLIISELPRLFDGERMSISAPAPKDLAKLTDLYAERRINSSATKKILSIMLSDGGDPEDIMNSEDLAQITDATVLREYLLAVIGENPRSVADYKSGKSAALKFIIGKAMAHSRGKADPELLLSLATELLDENT
ncbi:MAG: Asp-tRNA(Asn)/Glu-tRNA(Gln) amidotransferase subunit GatB [Clostridia bacterium]|nr:Asp-tRNA(Asn)/Glu-tRNA(Gln) amidotransferase subunit GatB [Clostridia bacterium]